MIKALLLIFDPTATWERIVVTQRSLVFVLVVFLFPLLLLASAAEGFGLVHWGKWQGEIGRIKQFPIGEATIIEAAQFLLALAVVFVGANMLKSIGETFHGRHTYTQAFTAVAYGLSPFFMLRLLDASPGISPWVGWAVGIILTTAVLYHGVPRVMEPDPPHAFGLFFMTSLLLALITGLVRLLTASYLEGKFPKLQMLISHWAARLPF
jgi:hypothetical protein